MQRRKCQFFLLPSRLTRVPTNQRTSPNIPDRKGWKTISVFVSLSLFNQELLTVNAENHLRLSVSHSLTQLVYPLHQLHFLQHACT